MTKGGESVNPCADQKENLILYVYGELDSSAVNELENHLKICEGCLQEKERFIKLLGKIEETSLFHKRTQSQLAKQREKTISINWLMET